jgi:Ariadne domain
VSLSLHSSVIDETCTGFFRCNRWTEEDDHQFYDGTEHNNDVLLNPFEDLADPRTLEATYGTAMHESRAAREKSSKMDRFIHHYQRWSAHRDSAALERHMWDEAVQRLAPVVDEMLAFTGVDHLFGGKGLCFIHAAFTELLESRSMLQHSYAFSYHRYLAEHRRDRFGLLGWKPREKSDFERAQSELELLTEQISDVVARKHIRATHEQIVYLTKATAQKRNDFSNIMVLCLRAEKQEEEEKQQQSQRSNGGLPATTTEPAARVLLQQSLGDLLAENGLEGLLEYDSEQEIEDWMCPACTFVNTGRRRCEMCNGYRPR